jgi:hypothetical protein
VSLGKTVGLEVNEADIQELEEDYEQEIMEDVLSEEEEIKAEESLTSNEIREMCKMWETVQNFVEKHQPNKAVAVRAINIFNDNAMSHFREILKRRQKQVIG